MQIAPNSTIILYSGMPLDDTYTDTLYFDSLSAQTSFFMDNPYVKRRFDANYYQRVNVGVFEANCLADELYDCNYMAFRNTNFGNKWFYAFVNSVEYVNNGNARVSFTIDVMQSYFFDAELEECFVEREHTRTDHFGDNILPEPIATTEYVFDGYGDLVGSSSEMYTPDIIVMYVDVDSKESNGKMFQRTFSGATLKAYSADGVDAVNEFIGRWIQKPDAIVNIYMCPHWLSHGTTDGREITQGELIDPMNITIPYPVGFFDYIEGYEVQNKKVFTYPYCYLHIDNGNQNALSLRYEFFDGQPELKIFGTPLSPVQMTLSPQNYKGNGSSTGLYDPPLMTETLVLSEYPICSWNYDTYKAWLAQNSVPMILRGVSSVVGGVGSIASGNVGGAVTGMVQEGLSIATDFYRASIQADTIKGNINQGNSAYANRFLRYHYARARLPLEYIKLADNYFTMYGYSVKTIKKPNRNVRPHFTYTKTSGAKIIGKCPVDDLAKLCSIYDNGVTFWKNASELGNYSLDNRPV